MASGGDAALASPDQLPPPAAGVLRVAVDLDEVLGYFVKPMLEFVKRDFAVETDYNAFSSYHFSDVWGCSDEEAMVRVEAYCESDIFTSGIPVVPGAQETLAALHDSGKFEFVLVTSRQHSLEALTREWLDKNFKGVFSAVVFGNHYGRVGPKVGKAELCRSLHAEVLIDDRVKYCKDVATTVRTALLFGDYAWNRTGVAKEEPVDLPENIVRVNDWAAAAAQLEALHRSLGDAASAGAAGGSGSAASTE